LASRWLMMGIILLVMGALLHELTDFLK